MLYLALVVLAITGVVLVQWKLRDIAESNSECPFLAQPLHLPHWATVGDYGLRKSAEPLPELKRTAQDYEEQTAIENLFHDMERGLIVELGAVDGIRMSISEYFRRSGDWRSILIEGNKQLAETLPANRPDAVSFNLVICNEKGPVHFLDKFAVGGVSELMGGNHKSKYYKRLQRDDGGGFNYTKLKETATETACYPLKCVFYALGISHVNFLVLDLEGGELSALESIDFHKTLIDVIVVETNPVRRPQGYTAKVARFLESQGMEVFKLQKGKNSWFVRPDFQPSVKRGFRHPL